MIELKNVVKTYSNGTTALNGISLNIDEGEFVFVVGESGAGKSTLLKLLLREEKVTSGSIVVDETDLTKLSYLKLPYYRRKLGVVFQDFRLLPNKTIYENVAFVMQIVGTPTRKIKKRVPALLRMVGLSDKASCFPKQISGGEQQRAALARALANNPKIIIADEPTGNVDLNRSYEMMDVLVKINKLGKTVVVVTHAKELVDYYKQRVIVIDHGTIADDRVGGMYE